jgi:dinuclear metal center YbgI/SA1388 family protein
MTARPLNELVSWLDALLEPARFEDYAPNGLQIDAERPVTRVATGVTANLAFLTEAAAWGAELAVVHHGLYWHGGPVTVTGALGRRVRLALARGLSVAGYHLPLDAHLEVGNAAGLARAIGLTDLSPAFFSRGAPAGCLARLPTALPFTELRSRLEALFPGLHFFAGGPAAITSVGVVTGGAPRMVSDALRLGCDLFITGEATEQTQATSFEEGIHVACCGHHRSERFGPMALAARLADAFPGLETRYLDVDNPA